MEFFSDEIMQGMEPIEGLSLSRQIQIEAGRLVGEIEKARSNLQESETQLWVDFTGIEDPLNNRRVGLISHRPNSTWNQIKTTSESITLDGSVQFTIYETWHESKVSFSVERNYLNTENL